MTCPTGKRLEEVKRGSTLTLDFDFIDDETGNPVNMTGINAFMTIRSKRSIHDPDNSSAIIHVQLDPISAPLGQFRYNLSEVQTDVTPDSYIGVVSVVDTTKAIEFQKSEQVSNFIFVVSNNIDKQ